jgi:hypothetical protein
MDRRMDIRLSEVKAEVLFTSDSMILSSFLVMKDKATPLWNPAAASPIISGPLPRHLFGSFQKSNSRSF